MRSKLIFCNDRNKPSEKKIRGNRGNGDIFIA